jgi:hypothetical protein
VSSVTIPTEQWPEPTPQTERVFRELADAWVRDVPYASDKHTMVTHPYYLQIIGLGPPAVRLLLRELQRSPNHWLWALQAITRQDPAAGQTNLRQAIAAWLAWGKSQGLVA